jgi:hypothetical protein
MAPRIGGRLMTLRSDGRRLIQLTMRPDLYDRIREHCRRLDVPITVWARSVIVAALEPQGHHHPK